MGMPEEDQPTNARALTDDEAQLAALGYSAKFDRTMSLWENFALGFTYLSPVVSVYAVFNSSIAAGGPPMIWSYLMAGMGQMLVCLVFSEVVSQFPISGGIYPWCRRLVGKRWAWIAGWIYGWALFTTISSVSVGAGPFLAELLGLDPTPLDTTLTALVMVATATGLNLMGTRVMARVAMFGFVCELVGAIVVGLYLLFVGREQSPAVLFDTIGIRVDGSYLPAFLTAALAGLYCCYGFEACGDVAEETPNPGKRIPKAMRMTIYVGVGASIFVCFALTLAVPDFKVIADGTQTDPVNAVLARNFGATGMRFVIAIVLVSFLSGILSLQAAVSRLLFAYARDEMIVGSKVLGRLSASHHVPVAAILLSAGIAAMIDLAGLFLEDAVTTIVSFATAGIYVAFQLVVIAALFARYRGWQPKGQFTLGRLGLPINIAALIYGWAGVTNIVWPRAPDQPWYINWGMILTFAIVLGTGLLYLVTRRPYDRGDAPAGDAWLVSSRAGKQV
jgi:amino acid transporter